MVILDLFYNQVQCTEIFFFAIFVYIQKFLVCDIFSCTLYIYGLDAMFTIIKTKFISERYIVMNIDFSMNLILSIEHYF